MDTSCGIGCRIATLPDGRLHFAEVHSWGGAAQCGHVVVGDVLHCVNGAPVTSTHDAKRVILGKPGTSLTLGIRFFANLLALKSKPVASQPPAAAPAFTAASPLCAWHAHHLPPLPHCFSLLQQAVMSPRAWRRTSASWQWWASWVQGRRAKCVQASTRISPRCSVQLTLG